MPVPTERQRWQEYCETERTAVAPLLAHLGFALDAEQPHLGGERYLMYAITTESGRKLILLGTRVSDGLSVVIKATSDVHGARELAHERICRQALKNLRFAYDTFRAPEEILFTVIHGFTLSIQRFIAQEQPFLSRPFEEQFSLVLRAFKAQESAHATTYAHRRYISSTFGYRTTSDYLESFARFADAVCATPHDTEDCAHLLQEARTRLDTQQEYIEQYGDFLTHTDFVPHNFRVVGTEVYLLDHSAIRFGNKYEGWARLINFMSLYHPALAQTLDAYVRLNRTPEESAALALMRLYRLGEILYYYTRTLEKSDGDLRQLNEARVHFWTTVLDATLRGTFVDGTTIAQYTARRDQLRSADERQRQIDLH